ncbi:uncharacterized protein LY79DRAFT_399071 [Colletotrichum navitas]|uniref:Uncharacterized protein n=1 Tax=Colletotrichum navitas TaxID=681940 RepID=A0AAD8PP93_9PEZI|nr:uncharacterized protein LY79DRAFT_399071 [Colletotrichum navitas]KAK1573772.1 hypothetical protein LY79DRAFT_399071 [Colletotrichum navitas]
MNRARRLRVPWLSSTRRPIDIILSEGSGCAPSSSSSSSSSAARRVSKRSGAQGKETQDKVERSKEDTISFTTLISAPAREWTSFHNRLHARGTVHDQKPRRVWRNAGNKKAGPAGAKRPMLRMTGGMVHASSTGSAGLLEFNTTASGKVTWIV